MRVIRAHRVALCILALLVGVVCATPPEHAAAMDPTPLPIKMPSPSLVKGFNQIANAREGGAPSELHAAVYFAMQQAWPSQAKCKTMPFGCWPSITPLWNQYRIHPTDNPMAFRDGGLAQEWFFVSNQLRSEDYKPIRVQLYLLYSGGALPGEVPNRAINYSSIDEAVDYTVRYYNFLKAKGRMQAVLTRRRPV